MLGGGGKRMISELDKLIFISVELLNEQGQLEAIAVVEGV